MSDPARTWQVLRVSGLLVPGFTKRFDPLLRSGTTYFLRLPIGRFDVVRRGGDELELRYRRWPVVDRLAHEPRATGTPGAGYLRLPGAGRTRFCTFRLVTPRD